VELLIWAGNVEAIVKTIIGQYMEKGSLGTGGVVRPVTFRPLFAMRRGRFDMPLGMSRSCLILTDILLETLSRDDGTVSYCEGCAFRYIYSRTCLSRDGE
jgi:hypothetical protein